MGATAVTTMVPPLPASAVPSCIRSPYITPGVMITLSAIWPQVSSVTVGKASSIEANVCVAPISIAFSRLNSTGSTAMTRLAPAMAAPCTALMPMPPMPTTTTVSPGRTSARLVAEPQPVATPHDDERDHVERQVGVDLDDRRLRHARVLGERAELGHQLDRAHHPSKWRAVPSVIMPFCMAPAPASHRFCRPVLQ